MGRFLFLISFILCCLPLWSADLYVIGADVNGQSWVLEQPDAKMTQTSSGVYEWSGKRLGSSFKINDGSWVGQYNIGSNGTPVVVGSEYKFLFDSQTNFILKNTDAIDNPHLVLDLNNETLLVEGTLLGEDKENIFIAGTFNEWGADSVASKMTWNGEVYIKKDLIIPKPESEYGFFKIKKGAWIDSWGFGPYSTSDVITESNLSAKLTRESLNPNSDMRYDISGTFDVTWDPVSETVTFIQTAEGENILAQGVGDLYIIGDNVNGNNWLLSDPSGKFTFLGEGIYEWTGAYMNSGFKINDGTWDCNVVKGLCLNIGSDIDNDYGIVLGEPYTFSASSHSGNLGFANYSEIINPLVRVNLIDRTITVSIDGHNLDVSIPSSSEGVYKNCFIELVDNVNGTKSRALVSNRDSYTFQGLKAKGDFSIRLVTANNFVIGSIDHFIMPSEDTSVEFENIHSLHNVAASVYTPDGTDVTEQTVVEWFSCGNQESLTYFKKARNITDCPEGEYLSCKVTLDRELGSVFENPSEASLCVGKDNDVVEFRLEKFKEVEVSGKITDENNMPLKDVTVSCSLLLNNKYPKTVSSISQENGEWRLTLPAVSDMLFTCSAPDYLNVERTVADLTGSNLNMGEQKMKRISGITIDYEISFNDPFSEEVESTYSDYRNVAVGVFDKTQGREIEKVTVQYPRIIIYDSDVKAGDELLLTASSKTGTFVPVTSTVIIPSDLRSSTSFMINGKGGLKASFGMTENKGAVCMLYNSENEFLKKGVYKDAKVEFSLLDDGKYSLVSMGQSDFISYFSRLGALAETGLKEGIDFIVNEFDVQSGNITEINNAEIPTFDESRFYFTNSGSDFKVNKTSITTGNFLTLSANIDFKESYKNLISKGSLLVEMPSSAEFIENSVIQGSKLLPYSLENNSLLIPLTDNLSEPIRFCVMPTESGSFNSSAYVTFEYEGEMRRQPIGAVTSTIKDLEIIAPSIISESEITVRGKALPNSTVRIHWDDKLMGMVTSNNIGEWEYSLEAGTLKPYTMHTLYADIESETGVKLVSETKTVLYDNDSPRVFGVEMINQAHRYGHIAPEITYFDYVGNYKPRPYWYLPSRPTFTFRAVVKEGEHTKVKTLTIFALTESGEWVPMKATYNKEQDKWIASKNFYNGNLPVNVGVSFTSQTDGVAPERIARLFLDNYLASRNKGGEELSDNFTIKTEGSSIKFEYGDADEATVRINSVDVTETGGTISKYIKNGVEYTLLSTNAGCAALPSDAEEFSLGDGYSFYISTKTAPGKQISEVYYPVNFIEALLKTIAASEDDTFDFFRDLLQRYKSSKYIMLSYTLEGSDLDEKKNCNRCDEAEYNCPDLAPIIDNLRYREQHSNNMNNRLDNFRNALDWVERALGFAGEAGDVAAGGVGLANQAVEFGQAAGNYINNLRDRNDFAALEAAGCLPGGGDQYPLFPSEGGSCGYVEDPSGYVYEAVPSNRVEGVQASIYYKDIQEDMYGDTFEVVTLWDAEEYSQKNPLFTDKNGMYQWDVPKGMWQVKLEKEGYETAYSDWLPVPPPQLDVNIPIVQLIEPEIVSIHAYNSGVEIEFSKYMDISTLNTGNIHVFSKGIDVAGSIELLNAEDADPNAEETSACPQYASLIRFNPETLFASNIEEVTVAVSRNVRSYAGIHMSTSFRQPIDVEPEVYAIYAEDTKVKYGETKRLTVSVLPPEAAVGQVLTVVNSADMIATLSADSYIIDEEGKVELTIKGDLPGLCELYFSIEDVTTTGECTIDVLTEILTLEKPQASRATGTEVYRGTKIELTTDTEDGIIYYTLDGSCPCEENGTRRKYTSPIVITSDTQILAITLSGNGLQDYSETAEFNYKIKRNSLDLDLQKGWNWLSHSSEIPVSAEVFFGSGAVNSVRSSSLRMTEKDWNTSQNQIFPLKAGEMFKVEADEHVGTIRIEDYAFNPATPLHLDKEVNWLGYPIPVLMNLDEAFSSDPDYLDLIIGQEGFAQFDGKKWCGTLSVLSPGKGYIYNSTREKDIIYNNVLSDRRTRKRINTVIDINGEQPDIYLYPEIMPVVFKILNNEEDITAGGLNVMAYSDDKVRGKSVITDGIGFLSIYGNSDDQIKLELTDNTGKIVGSQSLSLVEDKCLGSLEAPYIIQVSNYYSEVEEINLSGIGIELHDKIVTVSGVNEADKASIKVIDMRGTSLITGLLPDNHQVSLQSLNEGVYFIQIITRNKMANLKVILP